MTQEQKPDEQQREEDVVAVPETEEVEVAADEVEAEVVADPLAELQAALEQSTQEIQGFKDQALRAQAEAQNVKRRAAQDVEKARKFALEKFAGDLLPVVDSLERALESSPEQDAMREGIEMTLKMMVDTLVRYGMQPINPVGEPFDPQFHQAMTMQENADVEPNTVLTVFQKGYLLNGRLVRPAMVVVSKGGKPVVDAQVDEKV